ncbi:MAG: hypothetical protein LBQ73_06045, partial [Tannerellaceae bacterium]|nr:hypothetical protein [Tannerellaceae bacterium]
MKNLILLLTLFLLPAAGFAQTYHEADKATLRAFLSQPSAFRGETNGGCFGLTPADTAAWTTNEDWVAKVSRNDRITWNSESPKRVAIIKWGKSSLAGSLDLSGCTALTRLECNGNQLTGLDVSANTALDYLDCSDTPLTDLDVSA